MRHEEGVLPTISLDVVGEVVGRERVQRLAELAGQRAPAKEAARGVVVTLVGTAAPLKPVGNGGVPEGAGDLRDGRVRYRILERLRQAPVLGTPVERDEAPAAVRVQPALRQLRAPEHRLIGGGRVVGIAFQHQVPQRDHARVSDHAVRLVGVQVPHRQFALAAVDVEICVRNRARERRVDQRHQRLLGAVGVPEREDRVLGEVRAVNQPVRAAILPVHVAEQRGEDQRMVERGVEDAFLTGVQRLDPDRAEGVVPLSVRSSGRAVEVPAGQLFAHVHPRPLAAHGGQRYLHPDGLRAAERELEHGRLPVVFQLLDLLRGDRLAQLGREIPAVVARPALRTAEALDVRGVQHRQPAVHAAVPADSGLQVQQDRSLAAGERILMQPHPLGRGKAGANAVVRKGNRVFARPDLLERMVQPRIDMAYAVLLLVHPALGAFRARGVEGHQEDVAAIADSRAGKVRVAEAYDQSVRAVIPGAPVPRIVDLLRPERHHPPRHARPHEHVPVPSAADPRIDFGGEGR